MNGQDQISITVEAPRLAIGQLVDVLYGYEAMELDYEPRKFQLSAYEWDVMPALIGKLTEVGIERAQPRWQVGRVRSFDALPYQRPDPVVIVCGAMDLTEYYHCWHVLVFCDAWQVRDALIDYDAAVKKAIRSARDLTLAEVHFAMCEMMHFRNKALGRAR